MNKLVIIIISVFLLSSCESIPTKNLKKPGEKCPPQSERTLADIFCRE